MFMKFTQFPQYHFVTWMVKAKNLVQAPVVKKYPAKLTLTSFTCFFGLIQFLIIAAFAEDDWENWKIQSLEELFIILYAVMFITSILKHS